MRRVRPSCAGGWRPRSADIADSSGHTVEEWKSGAETDLLERGHGFLAGDLAALSAQQVAARLEEQLRFVEECFTWRARLHATGIDAIGRLGLDSPATTAGRCPRSWISSSASRAPRPIPQVAQLAIVDLVR